MLSCSRIPSLFRGPSYTARTSDKRNINQGLDVNECRGYERSGIGLLRIVKRKIHTMTGLPVTTVSKDELKKIDKSTHYQGV